MFKCRNINCIIKCRNINCIIECSVEFNSRVVCVDLVFEIKIIYNYVYDIYKYIIDVKVI